MAFHSYLFVLLFLPAAVALWYALGRFPRGRRVFALAVSAWFCAASDLRALGMLSLSILGNWCLGRWMAGLSGKGRKGVMALAVAANVGALGLCKYLNFGFQVLNKLLGASLPMVELLLPLGISFYTFQQLAWLVDVYRGSGEIYSLLDYAGFLCFFPCLSSGPIVWHSELVPQLRGAASAPDWDRMARGLFRFCLGMGKKVLLADPFGAAAAAGFGAPGLNSGEALLTVLCYSLQLYFDFSGYSDMALGVGELLGITLPENFESPYKALTIADFWDRWHKTLTRFFTRYLYIPLGGSRRGSLRTWGNVVLIFLVSGLWHGANVTFVVWGALHGLASVLYRICKKPFDRLPGLLKWAMTFLFIQLTWIFFRADSLVQALELLKAIAALDFGPLGAGVLDAFLSAEWLFLAGRLPMLAELVPWLYVALGLGLATLAPNSRQLTERFRPGFWSMAICAGTLVWSVFSFAGVSTFLYANF